MSIGSLQPDAPKAIEMNKTAPKSSPSPPEAGARRLGQSPNPSTDDNARPKRTWRRTPPPEHTPSTREWVDIARRVLVEEGVVEVKIDKLARLAGVTRGGFYWRFKNRDELLD